MTTIPKEHIMARALKRRARGTANAIATKKTASNIAHEELDLRRWCVEQANEQVRNGTWNIPAHASVGHHSVDVLHLAEKIYDWVTR